jgi:hypothetical protein
MAQEPDLDEWTCRAEACDLLHEPVSSQNSKGNFNYIIILDYRK